MKILGQLWLQDFAASIAPRRKLSEPKVVQKFCVTGKGQQSTCKTLRVVFLLAPSRAFWWRWGKVGFGRFGPLG